ncbi:MAG: MMPL family transporter [Anaerotardibacter sp.]
MTKYIPDQLPSKIGTDLMYEEFGESSQFNIMIMDLPDSQKEEVADQLENLPYIKSVQYEKDSASFNNGNATLYVAISKGDSYSQEALTALDEIKAYGDQQGFEYYIDSVVIDSLPIDLIPVLIPALIIVFGIMFLMANAWIEPVLLLTAVGMAIVINMGTNVIFGSVSETTFSIAAVLQLILSLDYSIMLITRYRTERLREEDKCQAMRMALAGSGGAIASSSATTIVGLVCLVFMSFTIGADMGLVLAKGVLMSLLCVYAVMPFLILAADNIIAKTVKRSPIPNTQKLSNLVYKLRVPILILFALLLATGLYFRNSTGISYFMKSENPDRPVIQQYFDLDNQVVVLYKAEDEENFAGVVEELEGLEGVTSVKAYANTLGKQYGAEQMADKTSMDQSFVELLYYNYYADGSLPQLSVNRFATFIKNDVLTNPDYASEMDGVNTQDINTLISLTTPSLIEKQRTASDMASYLSGSGQSMSVEDVQQIYLAYYINEGSKAGSMTLPQLVSFIQNEVATSPELSSQITPEMLAQIEQLAFFTDVNNVTTPLTADAMGAIFGLDAATVGQLYTLYGRMTTGDLSVSALSVQQFLAFLLDVVAVDPTLSPALGGVDLAQLTLLRTVVDMSVAGTPINAAQAAELFGVDQSQMSMLFTYYEWSHGGKDSWTLSSCQMVSFIVKESSGGLLDGQLTSEQLSQISGLKKLMDSALAGTTYSPEGLVSMLSSFTSVFDVQSAKMVYLLYGSIYCSNPDWTMSLDQFITYIYDDVLNDSLFANQIDDASRADIQTAYSEMQDGKDELIGSVYNMAVITSSFEDETDELDSLLTQIRTILDDNLVENYLLGQGAMAQEMGITFIDEFNFISLITVAAIFLIVLLAFRSFAIPLMLVLLIQCAFCLTMAFNSLVGSDIYYVALIVVQAILMGATIDYAILFTSLYREKRKELDVRESLIGAYAGSIRTMLTSGTILVTVTAIIGLFVTGITGQICLVISEGCFIALLLVLLVLPALLAIFDKIVVSKKARKA